MNSGVFLGHSVGRAKIRGHDPSLTPSGPAAFSRQTRFLLALRAALPPDAPVIEAED
jgi:hypothetical protein